MSAFDVAVGMSVREAREAAGVSQVDVAALMSGTWSQATVWATEKGERPLRFREVADLQGAIPGLRLTHLTADEDAAYQHGYQAALRDARDAIGELA